MPTFKERAVSDMRIPGYGGSYDTSYASGDDLFWAGTNQWAQRAYLSIGRYVHTPAGQACEGYTAVNPDYAAVTSSETNSAIVYGTWTQFLGWGQLYVSNSAQSPNAATGWSHNTRVLVYDMDLWSRSKNTGLWTRKRLSGPGNNVLSSVTYSQNTFNAADQRFDATTGGKSYRPTYDATAPTRPYRVPHWFQTDFTDIGSTADVADVMMSAKFSLVLHDPGGVDDRNTSAMMVSLGVDVYNPNGGFSVQPGLGISRPRLIRAKWPNWEWCVFHTMTEAQINAANGLPPSLVSLAEGGGEVSPPVDPPVVSPTRADWAALNTPRDWATRVSAGAAPDKFRRGRRPVMR